MLNKGHGRKVTTSLDDSLLPVSNKAMTETINKLKEVPLKLDLPMAKNGSNSFCLSAPIYFPDADLYNFSITNAWVEGVSYFTSSTTINLASSNYIQIMVTDQNTYVDGNCLNVTFAMSKK